VFDEVGFVEGLVVVEVVTAGVCARVEGQPLVRLALRFDFLVTVVAIVAGQAEPHGPDASRLVLGMARNAVARIELLNSIGIARVSELLLWVGVLDLFELRAVALDARPLKVLGAGELLLVADSTFELDLIVTVAGLSG
jgi:hypothetical protein